MPSILPQVVPTAKPENVRMATHGDAEAIYDLLQLLKDENAIFEMSSDKVRETIKRATDHQGGMIGVVEQDGKIVGTVGLFISQFWYTQTHHVEEYWNFVHPEYRRSNFAKDLINFAKWVNENMGLVLLMGIISTSRTKAKVELYARMLNQPVGAYFMNGLTLGAGPLIRDFIGYEGQDYSGHQA